MLNVGEEEAKCILAEQSEPSMEITVEKALSVISFVEFKEASTRFKNAS